MQSCTLCGGETWRVKKENGMAFQWTEMKMITQMYGVKITDRLVCKEFRERERLGTDDTVTVMTEI